MGPREIKLKHFLKSERWPGGEFKEPRVKQWGRLRWPESTTKDGGGGLQWWCLGEVLPLQVCLKGCRSHRKILKNVMRVGK